ncbi:MAG: leucine-rich repeat protein [Clostridia bacterium]|nr:leucine-rich repeat protein [Clostridia bacterium]
MKAKKVSVLITLIIVILLSAMSVTVASAAKSGVCGVNLTWTFDEDSGTLTFSGTGKMHDWVSNQNVPWYSIRGSIKSVVIPDGVTSIGETAFFECDGLTSIDIPDSVTHIGGWAFRGCDGLKKITIPDSVTSMGTRVFLNCSNLEELTLPFVGAERGISGDYKSVFGYIFGYETSSEKNTIPQYYGSGHCCYYYVNSSPLLKKVTITDETIIPRAAFYNCSKLTDITLSDSVTSIQEYAFRYCNKLERITVDDNNKNYSSDQNGVLFNKDKTVLIKYPAGNTASSYVVPEGVTSISDEAFRGCTTLKSITIPKSVESLGIDVFKDCKDFIIHCEEYSYMHTYAKTNKIPFAHSYNITYNANGGSGAPETQQQGLNQESVIISKTIPVYDGYLFYGWSEKPDGNVKYQPNGPYSTTCNSTLYAMWAPLCGKNAGYLYSDGVLTILGTGAMNDYSEDAKAPWDVYKDDITKIIIQSGITHIGNHSFDSYDNLVDVQFPDTLKTIGTSAFEFCRGLTTVTIPKSITMISEYAFSQCRGITDVYYQGTKSSWSKVDVKGNNEALTDAVMHFETSEDEYEAENGVIYKLKNGVATLTATLSADETISIPSTITVNQTEYIVNAIDPSAFSNTDAKAIRLPDTITTAITFADCDAYVFVQKGSDTAAAVSGDCVYYKGDYNNNRAIDVSDAINLLRSIASGTITDYSLYACDVVSDNAVSTSDAIRLLQHIASPNTALD